MIEEKGIQFTQVMSDMVELKSCKKRAQSYKNHMHNELSIGIIRQGSTTVKFPGTSIRFVEGEGVIIPAKLSHMCSPDDVEQWQFDMLYINPAFYGHRLSFDCAARLSDVTKIEEFLTLLEENNDQLYLEEALISLLIYLSESTSHIDPSGTKPMDTISRDLKNYIENHYLDKISLSDLEGAFTIDKFTMIRAFRKKYNTTPMAYQLQLKIAEAKKRLKTKVDSKDVGYDLGFYDQAHFIKEFQKMNGLTPSAYQKSITKSSSH